MGKKCLPLGPAGFGPLWPPVLASEPQTVGNQVLGPSWFALLSRVTQKQLSESSKMYQCKHLMPYCTSTLTWVSTTAFPPHKAEQTPISVSVSIINLHIPPPSIPGLLTFVLGYPEQICMGKVPAPAARGWSCLAGTAGASWVATFQSHFMLCHQKARHTHWNAARALPQCLL